LQIYQPLLKFPERRRMRRFRVSKPLPKLVDRRSMCAFI
jgi:hypothetical protein